jgi:bacteriocin-like protein
MEKIMRKTNDTDKTRERELTEAELAAVSGGNVRSTLDAIFKAASVAAQRVG